MAFSPDSLRIYVTQQRFCNIWQPPALIRTQDLYEEHSCTTGGAPEPAQPDLLRRASRKDQGYINALDINDASEHYCCGKVGGDVVLYDMETAQQVNGLYSHDRKTIVQIVWSSSGDYIASADHFGHVVVKKLRKPSARDDTWATYDVLNFHSSSPISQLLFSPSEKYLLVSSWEYTHLWCLASRTERCRLELHVTHYKIWLNHPTDKEVLLFALGDNIYQLKWDSLDRSQATSVVPIGSGSMKTPTNIEALDEPVARDLSLEQIFSLTPKGNFVSIHRAVVISCTEIIFDNVPVSGYQSPHFSRIRVALLGSGSTKKSSLLQDSITVMSKHVNRLLGCFQGHVVFMDHQFYVCTWDLSRGDASLKRHFFLPKEWVSHSMLNLCVATTSGVILCPRNDQIAVIRRGIKL